MTYDAPLNSIRCYDLAIACLREQAIRNGVYQPRPDDADEVRWASEGPRPNSQLDTVRKG